MPDRSVPSMLESYLGVSREPEADVERVVDQCGFAKMQGELTLRPFHRDHGLGSTGGEGTRRLCDRTEGAEPGLGPSANSIRSGAGERAQRVSPLQFCDKAFKPKVNRWLLELFLKWRRPGETPDQRSAVLVDAGTDEMAVSPCGGRTRR